jgi:nicotinate-nucleotide pyrophosphorylase (carboxylating)
MLWSELERFVAEDIGEWDDSSDLVPEIEAEAVVIAREECIISGLSESLEILRYFELLGEQLFNEGEFVPAGGRVLIIRGNARKILQSERLILNFISRMSGISTLTRDCMLRAARSGCVRVACTRKTTPGFRLYEKRAVYLGGGDPHRFNLSDTVLIKDNHIQLQGLEKCLKAAKNQASFTKKIEVEVQSQEDMLMAAEMGADIIMFDNMTPQQVAENVEILKQKGLRRRLLLEASGGITPENIEDYAATGVDVISLGALTRNAKWIDLCLDIEQG